MWIAGGSLAAAGLLATTSLLKFLMPPARSIEGKTKAGPLPVAKVSELAPGTPLLREYGEDFVFLVRLDGSTIKVLNAACPHVACKLHFNEKTKQYDCPCHASSFAIDGKRLFGPAPRDMTPAKFETQGDSIIVGGFETA